MYFWRYWMMRYINNYPYNIFGRTPWKQLRSLPLTHSSSQISWEDALTISFRKVHVAAVRTWKLPPTHTFAYNWVINILLIFCYPAPTTYYTYAFIYTNQYHKIAFVYLEQMKLWIFIILVQFIVLWNEVIFLTEVRRFTDTHTSVTNSTCM